MFPNAIRPTLMGVVLLVAGCSTSAEMDNPFASNKQSAREPQLAAAAAVSQYPDQQTSDARIAAMISRNNNTIKIVNFSNEAINDAKVWVNGSFVYEVATIPPNGSVLVSRDRFYNNRGQTLSSLNTAATRVELQSGDNFYRLMGPVQD